MGQLGNRIRVGRLSRGWTMAELAVRLHTSASPICFWELGKVLPRPKQLPKLASVLGIDSDELAKLWLVDSIQVNENSH